MIDRRRRGVLGLKAGPWSRGGNVLIDFCANIKGYLGSSHEAIERKKERKTPGHQDFVTHTRGKGEGPKINQ